MGALNSVADALESMPYFVVVLACLTLGLAPFTPEPHIVEKLRMLSQGTLRRPIDIGDLCMHGAPWAALLLKGCRTMGVA